VFLLSIATLSHPQTFVFLALSIMLPVWLSVLATIQAEIFSDLADFGIPVDAAGRPPREVTEAAWRHLGGEYLTEHPGPCWALAEFGEPR
jgi:hypothetical protein